MCTADVLGIAKESQEAKVKNDNDILTAFPKEFPKDSYLLDAYPREFPKDSNDILDAYPKEWD